jgi:very-short-patch-repair endonuclease
MRPQSRSVERLIGRIASRQHGVVTRRQLLAAGMSRDAIKRRLERGLLHPVHRGVYRVGHDAPSVEARYLAAVLACGDGAVLSGRAAGFVFGLLKGAAPAPEVSSVADRQVRGVRTRRLRSLDPRDVTRWRGVPITSVPRTLVDLAAVLPFEALARACHEAEVKRRVTPDAVDDALTRRPTAPGRSELRAIFHGDAHVTLSRLEREFLAVLRAERLPPPVTNRPAGGRYVDSRWPERRLTVELDGYTFHHTRHAWEQDRRREREARARGDEFRRYTWRDVAEEPTLMVAELRSLLLQ